MLISINFDKLSKLYNILFLMSSISITNMRRSNTKRNSMEKIIQQNNIFIQSRYWFFFSNYKYCFWNQLWEKKKTSCKLYSKSLYLILIPISKFSAFFIILKMIYRFRKWRTAQCCIIFKSECVCVAFRK
jgi:hypothetical protein